MPQLVQVTLVAVVLTAAFTDLRFRRIPNWLTLFGLCAGLALNMVYGHWDGLRASLLGIGLALLVSLPFYLIHGMGGGDVKLMIAVGAFAGPADWLAIFVITSLLGGVLAIGIVLARGRLAHTLSNITVILGNLVRFRAPYKASEELDVRSEKSLRLPRGAVIALATLAFLISKREVW